MNQNTSVHPTLYTPDRRLFQLLQVVIDLGRGEDVELAVVAHNRQFDVVAVQLALPQVNTRTCVRSTTVRTSKPSFNVRIAVEMASSISSSSE